MSDKKPRNRTTLADAVQAWNELPAHVRRYTTTNIRFNSGGLYGRAAKTARDILRLSVDLCPNCMPGGYFGTCPNCFEATGHGCPHGPLCDDCQARVLDID